MSPRLDEELHMTRPFGSLAEEAYLNLQRTANALQQAITETLKPEKLTHTQYNVLRILRGAHRSGGGSLPCGQVGLRMVTREPDVTRLLDRLERRGLVKRCRDETDRRVVTVAITDDGLTMLDRLDDPIAAVHERQLGHLEPDELERFNRMLEKARDRAG